MVSTYTTNGGIEKIGTGEQSGTWGTTTNTNFDIIDRLTNGVIEIDVGSSSTSNLDTSDGTVTNGMSKVLVYTTSGTQSTAHTVTITIVDAEKLYFINNTLGQNLQFVQAGSTPTDCVIAANTAGIIYARGNTVSGSARLVNLTSLFPNTNTGGTGTFTSITANGGVTVDEITIDGDTITATDDFIIDAAADITLDAAGEQVIFKDGSTNVGHVDLTSDNFTLKSLESDKDFIVKGNDGGSEITAMTLDMSEAGNATFNGTVTTPGLTLGSTAVTSTADELNKLDGATVTANELNLLDGDTAVGSSITVADSDGIIVNDGGTMKTIPASAVKTYATAGATSGTVTSVATDATLSGATITSTGTIGLNVGLGDVGTYAFLGIQGTETTITAGQTYTRSSSGADNTNQNLVYAGFLMDAGSNLDDDTSMDLTGNASGVNPDGVWRAMGEANHQNRRAGTLFLRIS